MLPKIEGEGRTIKHFGEKILGKKNSITIFSLPLFFCERVRSDLMTILELRANGRFLIFLRGGGGGGGGAEERKGW